MQILVLIAYTVLLAAGTNAASFVNLNQSQTQYDAVGIEDAELSTRITGKLPFLPFSCTPNYNKMKKYRTMHVEAPGSICFAANGDFAVPPEVGHYPFFIFDASGRLIKTGAYPSGAYIISGCTFSSTALYFADQGTKEIYKYTMNGDFLGVFVKGYEFGSLAAGYGMLYAIVDRSDVATVMAYAEYNNKEVCRIKTSVDQAKALAFDTQRTLNVALRGN